MNDNDIKKEFEDFIEKLSIEICSSVCLPQITKINNEFEENNEMLKNYIKLVNNSNLELSKNIIFLKEVIDSYKLTEEKSEEYVQQIKKMIDTLSKNNNLINDSLSLINKDNNQFFRDLMNSIEKFFEENKNEVVNLNKSIDEIRDSNVKLSNLIKENKNEVVSLNKSIDEIRDSNVRFSNLIKENKNEIVKLNESINEIRESNISFSNSINEIKNDIHKESVLIKAIFIFMICIFISMLILIF